MSYSGFVNGDTAVSLTIPPAVTTTATAASGVGTYPITASGAVSTNANYTISYVGGTLAVAPAPVAVTANNASRAYGTANPSFAVSYSGFVNGDTATCLTTPPVVTTTATAASSVGTYAITASGAASANYTFTYVNGTLTVTPATLTITANDAAEGVRRGEPGAVGELQRLRQRRHGLEPVDAAGGDDDGDRASAAGTYPITPSGAVSTNANYTISYVSGTLTVTPAALTITAHDKTRTYGAANPALTVSYGGFLNGDTAASLATQPVVTTAATAASSVGAYAITATGASSVNYTIATSRAR